MIQIAGVVDFIGKYVRVRLATSAFPQETSP